MADVIEAQDRFAPRARDVFVSGEIVEPGTYRDIKTGALVTLFHMDTLPEEVRIVRLPRRFYRVDAPESERCVA
ncbi:MAG: hypothetical protein RMJ43_05965 [Chloroherpetonaceae bacterium]|nr:hypothetical protein [Chthonomonadaceae bacterium]MDW8207363.1 hypothetical protein [Chloroherpetonaceae bacterium]